MMIFSQTSLQDYVDCPRRFELKYLQKLKYPAVQVEPLEAWERQMMSGDLFHQLIYQHMLGLPEDKLFRIVYEKKDDQLQKWWENYLRYGLEGLPAERTAERTLSAPVGGYRLIAKYDLIAQETGQIVIVDWKTSLKRPKREWLQKRMQTVVYRYVLASVYPMIPPEQIMMRYWFAEYPLDPEDFPYDREQYIKDQEQLTDLIREIETRTMFELTGEHHRCLFCQYRTLCERGKGENAGNLEDFEFNSDPDVDFDLSFDQIAEVEF
ncbi:MAG: PD-(D/E)XK nuclease family protein [Anaerolineae bacterium]|nr:PD-(D/E)XK nuclease family protein [Anaerolineae bacterium]